MPYAYRRPHEATIPRSPRGETQERMSALDRLLANPDIDEQQLLAINEEYDRLEVFLKKLL